MESTTRALNLQYKFQNRGLLEEALRHSSFVNEQHGPRSRDNERLEFLGDAVLNLAVGDLLMRRYPELKEGELSRMRANLVNESRLAAIARSIQLGDNIQLGKGELNTRGREKNSILADALEAVMAAVYLDGGYDVVRGLIETHFSPLLESAHAMSGNLDFKSQLQERVQMDGQAIPLYKVVGENGPDHDKTFTVAVRINELTAEGEGKSKKLAEQYAAKKALEIMKPREK
ncbi:MAG: ribonuclease III [Desulfobacterales bacterium]|nr:ribonuclease III [Desulfobacterales bacterium]